MPPSELGTQDNLLLTTQAYYKYRREGEEPLYRSHDQQKPYQGSGPPARFWNLPEDHEAVPQMTHTPKDQSESSIG